jgi:hypothetical protein
MMSRSDLRRTIYQYLLIVGDKLGMKVGVRVVAPKVGETVGITVPVTLRWGT